MRTAWSKAVLVLGGACLAVGAAPPPPREVPLLEAVLLEVAVPPLPGETAEDADPLPPFTPEMVKKYGPGAPPAKLRQALRRAQVALWASSSTPVPPELAAEVQAVRKTMRFSGAELRTHYAMPAGPAVPAFKSQLLREGQGVARVQAVLEELHDELAGLEGAAAAAPPRWQATYGFLRARLDAQMVVLEEYQLALGALRKEFPPLEPRHSGWMLVPTERRHDLVGARLFDEAQKRFQAVEREHRGTVWADLARRARKAALGREWRSTP